MLIRVFLISTGWLVFIGYHCKDVLYVVLKIEIVHTETFLNVIVCFLFVSEVRSALILQRHSQLKLLAAAIVLTLQ